MFNESILFGESLAVIKRQRRKQQPHRKSISFVCFMSFFLCFRLQKKLFGIVDGPYVPMCFRNVQERAIIL